jgi:hypothetical protein
MLHRTEQPIEKEVCGLSQVHLSRRFQKYDTVGDDLQIFELECQQEGCCQLGI